VVERGKPYPREVLLERLLELGYQRNDIDLSPGRFRAKGEVLETFPAYETEATTITSRRVRRLRVVECLKRSISGLMEASFSM